MARSKTSLGRLLAWQADGFPLWQSGASGGAAVSLQPGVIRSESGVTGTGVEAVAISELHLDRRTSWQLRDHVRLLSYVNRD